MLKSNVNKSELETMKEWQMEHIYGMVFTNIQYSDPELLTRHFNIEKWLGSDCPLKRLENNFLN